MLLKKFRLQRFLAQGHAQFDEPPRGQKNEGPPDLEALWRDFNRRLSGLFGQKGEPPSGGGEFNRGNGPSRVPSSQFGGGLLILGVIGILLWFVSSSVFMVDASQRGVVMLFGKYEKTVGEGLQFRWPYPFGSHIIVNVSGVQTVEVGYVNNERNKEPRESLMLTDDENIVNIQFAVQYILNNPEDYVFENRDTSQSVKQVAETAMREIVGKSRMDYVLYEGREQIAAEVQRQMQQILDRYRTGIQISRVTLQNAQPPEQVQAAFDDAVKAGQDRERQKNEGQAYANDVIPKAQGTAGRLRQEAEGYRARVVSTAEGDASRFSQILTEYQKAPAVTRERMYIETMQQIFANTAKIMVDTRAGNNMLYLPLDKIMAQSMPSVKNNASEVATPSPAPATSAPTPNAPAPTQDARRDLRTFRGERS